MELRAIQHQEATDTNHYFPHKRVGIEYLGVALAGEVGEVCNDIKKWSRGDFSIPELQKRLVNELPDVLIYLVMMADTLDIDLELAYEDKKAYNDERYRRTTADA